MKNSTFTTAQKVIGITLMTIFFLAVLFARLEMFGFNSSQFSF